jgi:hypothetical protein
MRVVTLEFLDPEFSKSVPIIINITSAIKPVRIKYSGHVQRKGRDEKCTHNFRIKTRREKKHLEDTLKCEKKLKKA